MFVTVESQGVEAVTEMAFGSPHSVKLGNTPSTKQVLYRYAEIILASLSYFGAHPSCVCFNPLLHRLF